MKRFSTVFSILLTVITLSLGLFATSGISASAAQTSATPEATPAVTKLNLNTATDEEILTVPGVGDRMLREFKEYRPYTSILQFRKEIGKYVSDDQVAAYEKYVFVPVDPNQADTETLKQLPGVTDDIAAKLIAGRTYASSDAFLKALATYVTPEQAAEAKAYLVTG